MVQFQQWVCLVYPVAQLLGVISNNLTHSPSHYYGFPFYQQTKACGDVQRAWTNALLRHRSVQKKILWTSYVSASQHLGSMNSMSDNHLPPYFELTLNLVPGLQMLANTSTCWSVDPDRLCYCQSKWVISLD